MDWQLTSVDAFGDLTEEWDRLNATHQDQAILHSFFVRTLIDHFFDGTETLCVGREGGHIQAMGFLERKRFGQWQTVMPSQAPLGLFLFENHRFEYAAVKALSKALPGPVFMIDFLQVDSDGLHLEENPNFLTVPYIETGRLSIPSDYNAYFTSLSKNTRQNAKRIRNRLGKEGRVLRVRRITEPRAIQEALMEYGEIESRSWKERYGTAISGANAQGKFYADLLYGERTGDIHAEVWLSLIDSATAAVDLCIRRENTLTILKTTYSEDLKQYSPAMQLKLEMIKHYANESLTRIEFFGKAMDWHRKLTEDIREIRHITYAITPMRLLLALTGKLRARERK
jgi:CelD/BcsL family acetyltransferase involved in cellulose biosynthesis